jgi:hypothetical protein
MSHTRLLKHIVFRTKNSKNTIPEKHEKDKVSFEEEYRQFLIENGIDTDEQFFYERLILSCLSVS